MIFTTKADIRRKRQEDAKEVLWFKREYGLVKRVPVYVWVFHCPGIGGEMVGALGHPDIDAGSGITNHPDIRKVRTDGLMGGWYTYLIGQGISEALNFRGYAGKTIDRLMELFPLVKATTLFDGPDFDEWMLAFVEQYPKGLWCDVPQGKSPVWAEVKGGFVTKILGHAKWPVKATYNRILKGVTEC